MASGTVLGGVGVDIVFDAFRDARWSAFVRYAAARTGDAGTGRRAAEDALRDLRAIWRQALRSSSPSALAWDLLRRRVAAAGCSAWAATLYGMLSSAQADAFLLCHRVGLSDRQCADLMGITANEVTGLRRGAVPR